MIARNHGARDQVHDNAPRFRGGFGLHGDLAPAAAQRVASQVGVGKRRAGQGEEQGGKQQRFHGVLILTALAGSTM
jgi:hypothetical protein